MPIPYLVGAFPFAMTTTEWMGGKWSLTEALLVFPPGTWVGVTSTIGGWPLLARVNGVIAHTRLVTVTSVCSDTDKGLDYTVPLDRYRIWPVKPERPYHPTDEWVELYRSTGGVYHGP